MLCTAQGLQAGLVHGAVQTLRCHRDPHCHPAKFITLVSHIQQLQLKSIFFEASSW